MRLTVKEGFGYDTYKDTIRIHSEHRLGVRSGHLAKVWVANGKSAVVAVRGLSDSERDVIRLDLETRRRLDLKNGQQPEFRLRESYPWEALIWAAKASDPTARVATWIAIRGFVVSVVLSAAQLYQGWK